MTLYWHLQQLHAYQDLTHCGCAPRRHQQCPRAHNWKRLHRTQGYCVDGLTHMSNQVQQSVLAQSQELSTSTWDQLLDIIESHRGALAALLDLQSLSDIDILYKITADMDSMVAEQLTGVSPTTFLVVLAAGLVTSLSPCTLSVLPLTIGYIAGYSAPGQAGQANTMAQALAFSAGLASTLAALGVTSSLVGRAYGQTGSLLPMVVSCLAIAMGLNLLEVVQFRLPSLDMDVRQFGLPRPVQAYLAGATFALAASPCSTPILATLLAYVSTTRDPVLGGALLLAYTSGYVAPLLAAATFTGSIQRMMALRAYSSWIPTASGVLLVAGGTYGLLSRVLPA